MAKKRTEKEPLREAVQGYQCPCSACANPSDNVITLGMWCARCGHGYLAIGRLDEGSCGRCGAAGPFLEAKPTLPPPPMRTYAVRVRRQVIEVTDFEVATVSPLMAARLAAGYTPPRERWTRESEGAHYAETVNEVKARKS